MSSTKLIADSGATKAEWSLITNNKNKTVITQGISPYFLTTSQITELLEHELKPKLKNADIGEIHYYGTGCANPDNAKSVKKALLQVLQVQKLKLITTSWLQQELYAGMKKALHVF